jgi:hypothetical protein
MGFEAFSIVLETDRSIETLEEFFAHRQFKKKGPKALGTSQPRSEFEYQTQEFVIEASVNAKSSFVPQTRIEFALCSGDNADKFFVRLVTEYLELFPSEAWLLTSKTKGLSFGRGDTTGVLEAIRRELPVLREAWTRAFGDRRGPVRIADAYRFVGVV